MLSVPLLRGGTGLIDAVAVLGRCDIRAGFVVADLGCGGNGHFVAPLAHLVGPAGLVYAVDIQKKVLHAVEAKMRTLVIPNVSTIWSDLEVPGAMKIKDASCDIALVINVLFQNTKHDAIIGEAARIVRPGGRVVVIEWKPTASPFGPPTELRLSPTQIKGLAQDKGLRLYDEFDAGKYHHAEVFLKG